METTKGLSVKILTDYKDQMNWKLNHSVAYHKNFTGDWIDGVSKGMVVTYGRVKFYPPDGRWINW